MRPHHTNLVMVNLRKSFSVPLYRKGVELSFDDSQTVMDTYQQWLLLLIDLGYLRLEALERTSQRLLTDMVKADVLDLNNAFAECLHLVRLQNNKGFKALCSRISTHLYNLIKGDIALMSLGDVYAARRLIQAFAYTSRLSLIDIDLSQQMLEDYMEIEESLSRDYHPPLIRRLNEVIRLWMEPFDSDSVKPSHSKGAVAFHGRASLERKYKNLRTDQMLEYVFGEPTWLVNPNSPELKRVSETIFVAKSYKSFRTISMEPPTLMYFQQGVWKELDRLMLRDSYLRAHISVHDQSRNKSLARTASLSRDFATLDLSAASDSVSYKLVKELFRGTKVLRYLVGTRSRESYLPDGRTITLKKFAPMGSALCFPVETIIFAAICEVVTKAARVRGRYSVYGDDIIVPTQCVDSTVRLLTNLGFRVNHEKSFYHRSCWFRESCGGEYCDGFDVTPMRVNRKYAHKEQDVRFKALIDSSNEAYTRGYRHLRQFFISKIRSLEIKPLFAPSSILSDNYTNYHTRKRWNVGLQRIEVLVDDIVSRPSKEDLQKQDESVRYRHWLESTLNRVSLGDGFESVVCKSTSNVRKAWRCKPFELSDQEFVDTMRKRG